MITHQHIDHFGLASILARRSGAEVAALAPLAPYLRDFRAAAELDDRFAEQTMLLHGIPAEVVTALRAVSASFRAWGSAVEVTRPLHDGERVATARPHAARAPPPRPQPLRHGPPRRVPLDDARGRSPDQAHLLQPPDRAPARRRPRLHRTPPAGARRLHRLAAAHAGDGAVARAAGPRRADRRPRGADRPAPAPARPPCREDPRPDRRRAAHRARDRARSCGATSPSPRPT